MATIRDLLKIEAVREHARKSEGLAWLLSYVLKSGPSKFEYQQAVVATGAKEPSLAFATITSNESTIEPIVSLIAPPEELPPMSRELASRPEILQELASIRYGKDRTVAYLIAADCLSGAKKDEELTEIVDNLTFTGDSPCIALEALEQLIKNTPEKAGEVMLSMLVKAKVYHDEQDGGFDTTNDVEGILDGALQLAAGSVEAQQWLLQVRFLHCFCFDSCFDCFSVLHEQFKLQNLFVIQFPACNLG